jgi:hypothetical protein
LCEEEAPTPDLNPSRRPLFLDVMVPTFITLAPHLEAFVELRDRGTVILHSKTICELENIGPRI